MSSNVRLAEYPQLHRGILTMIGSALSFSIMTIMVKTMTMTLPVLEVVFFRSLIMSFLVATILVYQGGSLIGEHRLLLSARGLCGFISVSGFFYAAASLTMADATALGQTSTIFVPLLSGFLLREHIPKRIYLYILVAFLGALLLIKPHFDVLNLPGIAGLVSGFFGALAYISIKRLHDTESHHTMVLYFGVFSLIGSFVLAGSDFVLPNRTDLGRLMLLGIFGTVGQILMTRAYYYGPASRINPYGFSGVIFSAVWGFWLWNEIPDLFSIIGVVAIVLCGILVVKTPLNRGMAEVR